MLRIHVQEILPGAIATVLLFSAFIATIVGIVRIVKDINLCKKKE